MAERFPDFEILEIQELEENSEKQIPRKVHWAGVVSRLAEQKTRNLKPICLPMKQANLTERNRWGYMTGVFR